MGSKVFDELVEDIVWGLPIRPWSMGSEDIVWGLSV